MFESEEGRDPLEVLAAEFTARQRRGESPAISEYVARHPELAADIEELFPTITIMERLKALKEQPSGARVSLGGVRLEHLGDFRIIREIGRGGMGIVYEAFQESLGRHVAVKVLPRQSLLDSKQLRRFQREAQTAARLHHTNIVPVFGVGEHEGFHYIVMQLIHGAGLDGVLARLEQARVAGDGGLFRGEESKLPATGHAKKRPVPFMHGKGDGACFPSGSPDRSTALGENTPRPQSAGSPGGIAAGDAPRSKRGYESEDSRLARSLVEGRFSQPHDSDIHWPNSTAIEGQSAGEKAATKRPSSPPSAATEEFPADADTHVIESPRAESEAPAVVPSPAESWQLGTRYWRSVATIGLQVAEALHYAHAHHTLHRDIKPANLLLDPQGVVWITDFGLAKAMEQDNVTQTGAMVGTLRYMAPEQFSGRVDARGDIYSLGLTLYEMLILRPAFEDASRSGLIGKITRETPVRPRKLNPAVPRDLETIVLKAIAREPADRYQTAGELARDLECFLEDRPVRARRASSLERVWRWARRNRALASLAACTLLLLVVVAVVASVGYLRTARANAQEQSQRKKAEDTAELAIEALDNIFQQFAPDRTAPTSALLVVGDAAEEIKVPVQPVLSKETAVLLERMLAFYDRLAEQGGDDARLRQKVAEANRRVGDIRQRLGHHEESKAAYLRAIELYTRLADASPDDTELRAEIARIHNELGNVYCAMNEPGAGYASYMDALAILQADAAESSASARCQYELARTYYFLGRGPGGQREPPLAGRGGPRGMSPGPPGFVFDPRRRPRGPNGPGDGKGNPASVSPNSVAGAGRPAGPRSPFPVSVLAEGEESLEKAIALWQRLVADDSPWPSRGPRRLPEGEAGPFRGKPGAIAGPQDARGGPPPPFANVGGESEDARQKAVDLLERLVAEHPAVPDYRHLLARCYREMPPPRFGRGPKPAPDSVHRAVQILEKLVEEYPDVPDYRYDLSETYAMLDGRGPRAAETPDRTARQRQPEMVEKALKISEELVAEHPNIPDYAVSQVFIRLRLAGILGENDLSAAEACLRKALDLQVSLVHRYPRTSSYKFWMAVIQGSLTELLRDRGRLDEARTMLQASIASLREVQQSDPKAGPIRDVLAHHYMSLADLLHAMGDEQAAAEAVHQAEELRPRRPQ